MIRPTRLLALGSVVAVGTVMTLGNFHVVTGSGPQNPRLLPRIAFSLSELVVNEDALDALPAQVKAIHYPLSTIALERDRDRLIEKARRISNLPDRP